MKKIAILYFLFLQSFLLMLRLRVKLLIKVILTFSICKYRYRTG